jgi:hypothetical protein
LEQLNNFPIKRISIIFNPGVSTGVYFLNLLNMKKRNFLALCGIATLIACGGGEADKKLLIFGRGDINVVENNITMNDKSGSAETTIDVIGDKAVSYNVSAPSGKTTISVPEEKGFYILNLKTDTLVGSQQNIGSDLSGRTMTQEELQGKIDSLVQLTTGKNVTPGAHNYIVLPNTVVKVSANPEAQVFGPFTKIPGTLEADKDGKAPEIYKFYTNTEVRDLIDRLKKMTF